MSYSHFLDPKGKWNFKVKDSDNQEVKEVYKLIDRAFYLFAPKEEKSIDE